MDEFELFKQFMEFKKMIEQSKTQQKQSNSKVDKIRMEKLKDGGVSVNLNALNFRIQKYNNNYYMHLKIAPFIKRNSKGVYTIRIVKEEIDCIINALNEIKKEMDNVVQANEALNR